MEGVVVVLALVSVPRLFHFFFIILLFLYRVSEEFECLGRLAACRGRPAEMVKVKLQQRRKVWRCVRVNEFRVAVTC